MRAFVIILAAGVTPFLFTNCKDIGEIAPETEKMEPVVRKSKPKEIYPVYRTITDVEGRSIDAVILGKQNLQLALSKVSSPTKFIVSLDRLSQPDQEFFVNLQDGGKFSEIKMKLDKEAKLAGRKARWHMDVDFAEREAAKLDLPLLMTILVNGDSVSKNLESKLGFSREFRDWANKNLVLCMLRIDDPHSNRTSSYSAVENRNTAAKYGIVKYTGPTVLLIKPDESLRFELSSTSMASPVSAITTVSNALMSSSGWGDIVAQEAPLKRRASVNPSTSSGST